MAAEELAPGVDSVAVRPERQISIKPETSSNKQEIERRREIVRHFFNDFWMSADDKPRTFAERLNRAEGHINERLAACGETWQLGAACRKQLGLPPPKPVWTNLPTPSTSPRGWGTAAQGIFLKSTTGGTSGKIMNYVDSTGVTVFALLADGSLLLRPLAAPPRAPRC